MEVGSRGKAIRPTSRDRPGREVLVARIVAVEHGRLFDALVGASGSQVDEPRLRFEVVLPGGVVVEMVVTDVGESGNVEVNGAHALLDECMRCGLDDSALDTCFDHTLKPRLHLRRLGGGLPTHV